MNDDFPLPCLIVEGCLLAPICELARCSHLSADMGGYGKASGKGAKGPKGGKGKGKARLGGLS